MNKNISKNEADDCQSNLPSKHCLNCGTELTGLYCHSCGQKYEDNKPTMRGLIMTYFDNAFFWDPQFFKTFWMLIRKPGHLTNEYNAGKYISQEHPLKLNMFLLFVFVTLFVFFASADKMTDSVYGLTQDERVFAGVQFNALVDNPEYVKKMEESSRDTILLKAPLFLAENYPQIISNIETKEDTGGEALDRWIAVLPRVLIDDEIVVIDDDEYYHFNKDSDIGNNGLDLFNALWEEMVSITTQYFPMLLLLTVPFLTFALRIVQRNSKMAGINHLIFALHFTAFLESLMICVYILYLTISPSMNILQYAMIVSSCLYLTIAYRRVYESSWIKSVIKSLLISFIYFTILLLVLISIFFIACFLIAFNQN